MKKRPPSVKLVDFTSERAIIRARQDGDRISSKEQARSSTGQTSTGKSEEQACAGTTLEQASAGTTLEQASAGTTLEQASAGTSQEQASAGTSLEQASGGKSVEQASAGTSTEQAPARKLSWKTICEQLNAGTYVPPPPSTLEEQTELFAKQPGVRDLKRLFRDWPRLTLPGYVNFGNLLSIAQRYVEFRAIVRLLFYLDEALMCLSRSEQRRIIEAAAKVERYLDEVVEFADKPYDPKDIDDLFCRIGCRLDDISDALQKAKVIRHPCLLIYGLDVYPSWNRRALTLREKNVDVDKHFLKRIGTPQTYLRTRLDTEFLAETKRDYPEFRPTIKTLLNVYEAMKYLTYLRQLEVFKHLFELQELIRKLVRYKRDLDVIDFEIRVPNVINKVKYCLNKLLIILTIETRPPRPNTMPDCEPCFSVTKFVKNVNVKPEQFKPVYPQTGAIAPPISYANSGISQGQFNNIESLIHHLTALKGAAYKHTFLYQSRIDWFAIARQYKQYKTQVRQDMVQLRVWKNYVFWRLVEAEEVMVEARTLRERIRGVRFTGNETLSDIIALGGELELLVAEVEEFLTTIQEIIEDFVKEWQLGVNVNRIVRRRRFNFLTKDQLTTFFFPDSGNFDPRN